MPKANPTEMHGYADDIVKSVFGDVLFSEFYSLNVNSSLFPLPRSI